MKDEYTREINKYCDYYGDKLIELMDICNVTNLVDISDEEAIKFINKLKKNEVDTNGISSYGEIECG